MTTINDDADALLERLNKLDVDLRAVRRVDALVDVPPPQNLVLTQVRSIGSFVMGHCAFATARKIEEIGQPHQDRAGRQVLVAQTTLLCPSAHYGHAARKYIPSDLFRGFVGICMSNTVLSKANSEEPSPAKRRRTALKDDRMVVAVGGMVTVPLVDDNQTIKPGDFVAFDTAVVDTTNLRLLMGTETREVPEIMPSMCRFDPDGYAKAACSAPFAVCVDLHRHSTPRDRDRPETLTILLRMDLYNSASKAKPTI